MTRTIRPEFWTNCWSKTYLCYDIERIRLLYKECIIKPFENPERSANGLMERMLTHPEEYGEYVQDESDVLCMVEKYAFHEYNVIRDMQYRTRLLWICGILEIWEQNLSMCIIRDLCKNRAPDGDMLSEEQKNYLYNGFHTFERLFTAEMFDESGEKCILNSFGRYNELKELSLLANAIKHGRGRSLSDLQIEYPKYKMDTHTFAAAFEGTTIYTPTLNVTDDDFYRFCDVLIDFWKWIPDHIVISNATAFRRLISGKRTGGNEGLIQERVVPKRNRGLVLRNLFLCDGKEGAVR